LNVIELSEKVIKIKNRLFILSLVCLVIGLAKALPNSFNLIGIEFQNNKEIKQIIGWFLFYITLFYLLYYIILIVFKIFFVEKNLFKKFFKDDIYVITIEDIVKEEAYSNIDIDEYSISKNINDKYHNLIINIHNGIVCFFDILIPIILGIISLIILGKFLKGF